eukprot:3199243-Prymnesium_polylepis.2
MDSDRYASVQPRALMMMMINDYDDDVHGSARCALFVKPLNSVRFNMNINNTHNMTMHICMCMCDMLVQTHPAARVATVAPVVNPRAVCTSMSHTHTQTTVHHLHALHPRPQEHTHPVSPCPSVCGCGSVAVSLAYLAYCR